MAPLDELYWKEQVLGMQRFDNSDTLNRREPTLFDFFNEQNFVTESLISLEFLNLPSSLFKNLLHDLNVFN